MENTKDDRSDAEFAEGLRREAQGLLEQLCRIQDRARARGMMMQFGTAPDQWGKHQVSPIGVMKVL